MRREKLENLVTTGMLEGKRSRGKQREKLIEGLTDWLKAGKSLEAIEATKDRKKGVGSTVACESALRSAGTLLSRVRAPLRLTEGLKA
ncbi:LOW QUALITY PROTEIN: hypothetical protein PoB_004989100 [Plakobranchus ocellatus]|uniref:Uncharacterized protein n=1 Tax=Plakobranchus ocellatus TaxID=259542 RepID=A0AAV4BWB3_9GAST|nr:LOW QUALITY PROTEIN: hypothetical protein PoB_004989100 [Plakobranchus ocellatus]